jgi:biopolymer transport protein ExbB
LPTFAAAMAVHLYSAVAASAQPMPVEAPFPTDAARLAPDPASATALLPHDLSPWGMFLSADLVVQAVMVGLALASVITWTVWLAKTLELMSVKRRARQALAILGSVRSLEQSAERLDGRRDAVAALVRAAETELHLSVDALERMA